MILECFALSVQAVIEVVLGRSLTEAEVMFDYPPPTYHTVYRDYLHSPITFSSNDSEILLPAELASVPNTVADPETYAMAQALCSKLIEKVHHSSLTMTDRVRYLLLFKPMGSVTEEDVAQDLFVSTRTLARRLKREGYWLSPDSRRVAGGDGGNPPAREQPQRGSHRGTARLSRLPQFPPCLPPLVPHNAQHISRDTSRISSIIIRLEQVIFSACVKAVSGGWKLASA